MKSMTHSLLNLKSSVAHLEIERCSLISRNEMLLSCSLETTMSARLATDKPLINILLVYLTSQINVEKPFKITTVEIGLS